MKEEREILNESSKHIQEEQIEDKQVVIEQEDPASKEEVATDEVMSIKENKK